MCKETTTLYACGHADSSATTAAAVGTHWLVRCEIKDNHGDVDDELEVCRKENVVWQCAFTCPACVAGPKDTEDQAEDEDEDEVCGTVEDSAATRVKRDSGAEVSSLRTAGTKRRLRDLCEDIERIEAYEETSCDARTQNKKQKYVARCGYVEVIDF